MHYLLMGKFRLPFIDNDLLYRGVLYGRFDCSLFFSQVNFHFSFKTYAWIIWINVQLNDIWNSLSIFTITINKYISNSLTKNFLYICTLYIAIFEELHSIYAPPIHNSPVVEQTRQNRCLQSIDKFFGMTDQSLYQ